MLRKQKLKRLARAELERLQLRFPYYGYGSDPEKFNAIYPAFEWVADRPVADLTQDRDWQYLLGVDPSTGCHVEVFFERLRGRVAVVWARVAVGGRAFTLKENCYKDLSDVSMGVYSAGGVRLECHGPLRFWRVAINALLTEEDNVAEQGVAAAAATSADEHVNNTLHATKCYREVHVKLGARLSSMSHPFEIPKRCPPSMLVQRAELPRDGQQDKLDLDKTKTNVVEYCQDVKAFSQAVTWFCEVSLDGDRSSELLLFGCRLKFQGRTNLLTGIRHHIGYATNGTVFHLLEVSGNKCYGLCFNPTFFDTSILKGRIRQTNSDADSPTTEVAFKVEYRGHTHVCELSSKSQEIAWDNVASFSSSDATDSPWFTQAFKGTLKWNKTAGTFDVSGVTLQIPTDYILPAERLAIFSLMTVSSSVESTGSPAVSEEVVSTSDEACRSPQLTGGKGSSLAVLTAIAQHLQDHSHDKSTVFTVPAAVVLTVEAYKTFAALPAVTKAVEELCKSIEAAGSQNYLAALKASSERCVAAITSVALPASLEQLVLKKLTEIFGAEWENRRFAVRSSAAGEDSEEMSAAGQMTTCLGVTGRATLFSSIVKCWASQFSLTALNYKRQYGQNIAAPMAVVVQAMADAQCAGVMFTCDPVTTHPGRIVLTANFGLGESVVSASADPDTYTLQWIPNSMAKAQNSSAPSRKAVLLNRVCGAKARMIVESQLATGGVEEQIVPIGKAQTFCLSDDQAIRIATIGMKVTELTGTPRDIEWAMANGEVVLLQSRPVTSFFRETDFEVQHDLNSAFFSNRDIFTRANLDEVMPGVFSPMSVSVINHVMFERFSKKILDELFPSVIDHSQYTFTHSFSIGKKSYKNLSVNPFMTNKSFVESTRVTLLGFDISQHEVFEKGITYEKSISMSDKLKVGMIILHATRNLETIVNEGREYMENVCIKVDHAKDSLSLLLAILHGLPNVTDGLAPLLKATMSSSLLNMFALNTLKKSQGQTEVTNDMMVLLTKLLRSDHEVESARIPEELTDLSKCIYNDPRGADFVQMSVEDALRFLETDEGEAAKKFRKFRTAHGHRCYKEFDVYSKTWGIDATALVTTLQANVRAGEAKPKEDSKMTIADLEKQPSFVQRKFLSYVIPRAQFAVYAREAMKSVLVKCIHEIRQPLRRLGKQLQIEGRLPDEDLVFFLTFDEVYRLITTRNPSLIPRALRRQKMHTRLDRQKFNVLFYGMPKALGSVSTSIPEGAQSLSGTPVSEGVVEGVARVISDFESEAHLIQKGDILITHATDTGWTPYFPLLSGVVTEIGGLLSHGAVVAREYGLPAIVGVLGATEFFKSGETVTLDSNNGVIAKLQQQQQQQEQQLNEANERKSDLSRNGHVSLTVTLNSNNNGHTTYQAQRTSDLPRRPLSGPVEQAVPA